MVLEERGWKHGGDQCDPNKMHTLKDVVAGKHVDSLGEPIPKKYWLPKRAYWIGHAGYAVDDEKVSTLHKLPNGEFNRVAGFPGCEPATFKTACAKAHGGKPFSPEAFILPAERQKLIKAVKKDEDNKVQSWWIGKPENGGSGRGCLVYPSGH